MPIARSSPYSHHNLGRLRTILVRLVRLVLLTKTWIWKNLVKWSRKTYERITLWIATRFLRSLAHPRTKDAADECLLPSDLDFSMTCYFPHPSPSFGDSASCAILPAQLPTIRLPQVEDVSASGSDTESFVTTDNGDAVRGIASSSQPPNPVAVSDTTTSWHGGQASSLPPAHTSSSRATLRDTAGNNGPVSLVDSPTMSTIVPPLPASEVTPSVTWSNELSSPVSRTPNYPIRSALRTSAGDGNSAMTMPIPTIPSTTPIPLVFETPFTATAVSKECPRLVPFVPPDSPRYNRSITIPKRDMSKKYIIPPGQVEFGSGTAWRGWIRCTHPEGVRYYYNPNRRVYTEADLESESSQILDTIEKCISVLYTTDTRLLPDLTQCDLVLEYDPLRSGSCYYYFAHHRTRSIFWLEEYDLQFELKSVLGEITPSHLRLVIERLYWVHMSYFPYGHKFPYELIEELKSKLVWSLTDELISPHPLSFFNTETLDKLILIVNYIDGADDAVYALAIAGRLYNRFLLSHFINYHGEVGARLDSNQSVHGSPAPRVNAFMAILFLLLFNNPTRYLTNIHDIHTDGGVKEVTWRKHMEDFRNSWREYILYATVLLNANVALLAVPTITPESTSSSTVGEVASFLSIITSTGCVVVGLLLVRQHQIGTQRAAGEVLQQFLDRAGSAQRLAILYSVPYALLIWSVISFTVAISFACFHGGDLVATVIIAAMFFLVVMLAVWCAYSGVRTISLAKNFVSRFWKKHPRSTVPPRYTTTPLASPSAPPQHLQYPPPSHRPTPSWTPNPSSNPSVSFMSPYSDFPPNIYPFPSYPTSTSQTPIVSPSVPYSVYPSAPSTSQPNTDPHHPSLFAGRSPYYKFVLPMAGHR